MLLIQRVRPIKTANKSGERDGEKEEDEWRMTR